MLLDKNKFFDVLKLDYNIFNKDNSYFFIEFYLKLEDYNFKFEKLYNLNKNNFKFFYSKNGFCFYFKNKSFIFNLNFINYILTYFPNDIFLNSVVYKNKFVNINNNNIKLLLNNIDSLGFMEYYYIFLNIFFLINFFLKKLIVILKMKLC
jgi:hypothetical protein